LTFRINLPYARYRGDAGTDLVRQFLSRVRALPGVTAAGLTMISPWNGPNGIGVRIEGRPVDAGTPPSVTYSVASDGFFEALGIPLRAGRTFRPTDRKDALPVVIVSEKVAQRFWPNANPIGARLRLDTGDADSAVVREVIGVVSDVRGSVLEEPSPMLYEPTWQSGIASGEYMVRTTGDASALIAPIRAMLHELDPHLPLLGARTLDEVVREPIARQQLAMALMMTFAALALLLAGLGIYSVMAYSVLARTREFGVRAALGAQRGTILFLVLRQGLATTVVGTVCGLALAILASRFLASLLVGVSTLDAVTVVAAPALLVVVATAACMLPALRATKVQPVDALRVE
jgi:putative ABC transport system permease protein